MFTMAPLLMYSEAVPEGARSALRAAYASGDGNERAEKLTVAARILQSESGLDCTDIRELVGLPPDCGC